MRATRIPDNPIIHAQTDDRIGCNINGPSLVRAPPWLPEPLGHYYLYFAHHKGSFIRLAYADRLNGPWHIHSPGTLMLEQTFFCTVPPPIEVLRPETVWERERIHPTNLPCAAQSTRRSISCVIHMCSRMTTAPLTCSMPSPARAESRSPPWKASPARLRSYPHGVVSRCVL